MPQAVRNDQNSLRYGQEEPLMTGELQTYRDSRHTNDTPNEEEVSTFPRSGNIAEAVEQEGDTAGASSVLYSVRQLAQIELNAQPVGQIHALQIQSEGMQINEACNVDLERNIAANCPVPERGTRIMKTVLGPAPLPRRTGRRMNEPVNDASERRAEPFVGSFEPFRQRATETRIPSASYTPSEYTKRAQDRGRILNFSSEEQGNCSRVHLGYEIERERPLTVSSVTQTRIRGSKENEVHTGRSIQLRLPLKAPSLIHRHNSEPTARNARSLSNQFNPRLYSPNEDLNRQPRDQDAMENF
ncbi:hypothetical protein FGB62_18g00 [Gracilaria domingensis]|nr:hypothetical protein FGB62_18g00 [Gracilaria domingensis]